VSTFAKNVEWVTKMKRLRQGERESEAHCLGEGNSVVFNYLKLLKNNLKEQVAHCLLWEWAKKNTHCLSCILAERSPVL